MRSRACAVARPYAARINRRCHWCRPGVTGYAGGKISACCLVYFLCVARGILIDLWTDLTNCYFWLYTTHNRSMQISIVMSLLGSFADVHNVMRGSVELHYCSLDSYSWTWQVRAGCCRFLTSAESWRGDCRGSEVIASSCRRWRSRRPQRRADTDDHRARSVGHREITLSILLLKPQMSSGMCRWRCP